MRTLATPWDDRVLVLRADAVEMRGDVGLTEGELEIANAFKLAGRRNEWLLSRIAAKQLALRLRIATDPRDVVVERPFLAGTDWRVSLSHSAPYAGAAIAREPIGIDVQLIRELDERAAHLFLSPAEERAMQRCAMQHRILHWWCAKEAAWKQRSPEFATLAQLPLALVEEHASGMTFDSVETRVFDDVIVAVTRPVS